MANNRLYVGDNVSEEYIFIEKGWGAGWDGDYFNCELFKSFISSRIKEGGLSEDTNLFFFTEQSCEFSFIMEYWNRWDKKDGE